MRIIRSAEYREQRWRNGGGTTFEIAAGPDGADLEAFDWRLSMALVERAGEFSEFPDVDRTLQVLEGAGLALHFKDRGIVRLERTSAPYTFPGDARVSSTLADGPVRDLNAMSRRGRWRHSLFHVAAISRFRLVRQGEVTLALCRGATAMIGDGPALGDGDTLELRADGPAAVDLTIDGTADLYIADFSPVGARPGS